MVKGLGLWTYGPGLGGPGLGWFRGTVVERWFLTGKLSPSCTRSAADG